ncbi:HEAT repeat domain-containing protein [Leptolyngbya sp. 15MV]|nr:HEAT repeat domain-containing protein [Leptolyngbya sp. 15MV]
MSALAAVAGDSEAFPALRAEAVRALATSRAAGPIEALARQRVAQADVRLAVVEAVGTLAADGSIDAETRGRLTAIIRTAAAGDSLGRSRAAALRALGALGGVDALSILTQAADTTSDHDRVRRGAIDGLAALGTREALPVVLRAALPGSLLPTRERALRAIPRLARHDPDAVLSVLTSATTERTPAIWSTAGEALVELGDPRGVVALERLRDSRRDDFDRLRASDWLDALRAKAGSPVAPASAAAGDGVAWIPWGEASAIASDPAAHFLARGVVDDVRNGTVLLMSRAAESVGGPDRPLAITGVRLIEDGGRVRAIELALDSASADVVRGFTAPLVGGRVIVMVDERARGVLAITSPLGPTIQLVGPFGREEAQRIVLRAREPGGLRLRVAVRPGERADEAALREQLRSGR